MEHDNQKHQNIFFHEFTYNTYNKLSKVMCIWRAVQGEGSELSA